jgi:hypothetical protein
MLHLISFIPCDHHFYPHQNTGILESVAAVLETFVPVHAMTLVLVKIENAQILCHVS